MTVVGRAANSTTPHLLFAAACAAMQHHMWHVASVIGRGGSCGQIHSKLLHPCVIFLFIRGPFNCLFHCHPAIVVDHARCALDMWRLTSAHDGARMVCPAVVGRRGRGGAPATLCRTLVRSRASSFLLWGQCQRCCSISAVGNSPWLSKLTETALLPIASPAAAAAAAAFLLLAAFTAATAASSK